ncbi:Uncharacterised protein [Serratia grimesii]|nr:Uncharacterised protein [Serratia grimesii]
MAIYRVDNNEIIAVERTTFDRLGLKERQNLQSMLKKKFRFFHQVLWLWLKSLGNGRTVDVELTCLG